jgi:hypothetical protein
VKPILWLALLCLVSMKAFASDITLDLSVTGNSQKLTLQGKTNLPPKTILMAIVVNPIDQGGDGYVGSTKAAVSANQIVQFDPFSKSGGSLSPGNYKVTVYTVMAALQPQEVQPFFGAHGEGLTGRLVSTLRGTSERMVTQTFQFRISPDGSINGPPLNPPSNFSAAEHTTGSTGEKWQKVPGTDLYAMTNVGFSQGGIVEMYIVENLPESDIVGAPQSVEYDIWGTCAARQYTVVSSLFYSEKNRGGYPMEDTGIEGVERKVIPGSAREKAFDMLCKIAWERK